MLLQGANSSVEWKPHDMFLACSKAFRNLSRKTICPLKIESCFKIIFAAKRMDKYCWSRKHKVINYDTGSQEHRCLWIRSNCGINSSTFGFVGSIQQVLPKQLNSPCFPQPARGTGCYPWAEFWEGLGTVTEMMLLLAKVQWQRGMEVLERFHIVTRGKQQEAFR